MTSEPQAGDDAEISKKRKRNEVDESDPRFLEYLQVMNPSSKRAGGVDVDVAPVTDISPAIDIKATESDDEYEDVPARPKAKKSRAAENLPDEPVPTPAVPEKASQHEETETMSTHVEEAQPQAPAPSNGATDDEWLRSRTNRLLDLLDDDEPLPPPSQPAPAQGDGELKGDTQMTGTEEGDDAVSEPAQPEVPEGSEPVSESKQKEEKADTSDVGMIRKTARLFVRNLPYTTTEDDLHDHFSQYGPLEEVRMRNPHPLLLFLGVSYYSRSIMMNPEIGTSDAKVHLM